MQKKIIDFFTKPVAKVTNVTNTFQLEDKTKTVDANGNISLKRSTVIDEEEIMKPKKFKRLLVLSDDECSDEENFDLNVKTDKVKNYNISCSTNERISFIETTCKSPIINKDVMQTKPLTPSTKSFLAGFKSKANMFQSNENEATKPAEELSPNESFDHLSFEFLKENNLMDSKRRRPSHPDYDGTTLFVPPSFMAKVTPAMRQWWQLKATGMYDTLLFFKVGKFYELYHMDAVAAVNELGISFMRGNYAHCGFPEIAFSKMSDQLVQKGYKVARVEQTESVDAMTARCKERPTKDKVVTREVCQVVTPGTRTFSLRNSSVRLMASEEGDDVTFDDDVGAILYALNEVPIDDAFRNKSRHIIRIGVAAVNTTTGRFMLAQFDDDNQRSKLRTMMSRYPPNEIVYQKGELSKDTSSLFTSTLSAIKKEGLIKTSQFLSAEDALELLLESQYFVDTSPDRLNRFGLPIGLNEVLNEGDNLGRSANAEFQFAVNSLGGLIYYLKKCLLDKYLISLADFVIYRPTDEFAVSTISDEPFYKFQANMILDSNALINLDLLKNSSTGGLEGSLRERLDFTSTPFGKRLLLQWIATPLCNPGSIRERQDAISNLIELDSRLGPVRQKLRTLPDLEKLIAKLHAVSLTKSVSDHPDSRAVLYEHLQYSKRKINDFICTISAFQTIINIQSHFSELQFEKKLNSALLTKITLCKEDSENGLFPNLEKIVTYFQNCFDHEVAKKSGKIIPEKGVDADYDSAIDDVNGIERELEKYLKEQCGLFGCKISYFGSGRNRYQLEVPESRCKDVPRAYAATSQRKGFRRYETNETQRLVAEIIAAEERRDMALSNIMSRIFAQFDEKFDLWTRAIDYLAQLDVLLSLACYSKGVDGGQMVLPDFVDLTTGVQPQLLITEGRYPCRAVTQAGEFISNTVILGTDDSHRTVMMLTGPNMGGKSTLMRQTALIVILAQLGCRVPAEGRVSLTPVDRVLTRQGASDSLHSGQSTLQVELNETASILAYLTAHSLLLVDELGRGTATHDGCALASAILHRIADRCAPRTVFSTHFHRLLEDEALIGKLQVCHMACMVEEAADGAEVSLQNITFLYKLTAGGCPRSHGFHVARLASVSNQIIAAGARKARLLERDNLVLEFRKLLVRCKQDGRGCRQEMLAWQQKLREFHEI